MRRSIVLIILAGIAIAAAFAWRSRTAATSAASAPAVYEPAAKPVPDRKEVTTRPKSERSVPEAADDRPFTEIRPELERRALAGDAQAARRLGMTLANCNHYIDVSDNKLEEMVVDQAARGFTAKIGDHEASPEQILKLYKLSLSQKRRDCKGVSGLDEANAWKLAFQWIERAAALGDPDAQAVYGTLAFSDFDTRNALVDAEKMRDRKQLATDYLQRALARGDGLALIQMAGRYQDGLLFPPDPEKAYAYVWAYSLTARAGDLVPGLLDELLVQRGVALDEAALERARLEGQQLATCCGVVATQTP
jgi:TPR repeat protein